jgi:predicted peroxiredoxin
MKGNMPAIASLEDLKAAQKEGVSIYAMRFALCFTKMAQDRLEECLQAVVTGTHPRKIER